MVQDSVIIPVFNAERYTTQAIDSVLSQTFDDLDIIAVDDGSTDASAARILSCGEHVRYFHQQNSGQAIARNHGCAQANGTYLAFLDADDQ